MSEKNTPAQLSPSSQVFLIFTNDDHGVLMVATMNVTISMDNLSMHRIELKGSVNKRVQQ